MKCKLSEVMDLIGGGTPKTSKPEYWNGNIPWISVKDFNNDFRYVYKTEKSITQLGLQKSSTKLLQRGDVIISARGTVGEIATIPFAMAFNQSCYGLRAKKGMVTSDYLYYLIKHNVSVLKKNTHGSVFDTITRNTFDNIEVEIPSIKIQQKISSILNDYDKKIELNSAINNNLEHQAQAIFKNSFVDFSPFDGIQPHSWTISSLGAITNMVAGGDKPKVISTIQTEACPYPIYANGLRENGLYGYTNTPKICDESVTVSARGTVGFVCIRHTPYVPIVRLVALIPNIELVSVKYLYLYLKQLNITGTGTTQQQLTIPDFKKTPILIPDKETMSKFTNVITPLFLKIWANEKENSKLLALRDTLLPQLMSGKLEVSEINI